MITGGYEIECCHVYFVARRNVLDESLHKIGFEKHSIDDVHKMNWETLEREIESWIRIFKQFTTVHFINERKLSDAVFFDHPKISENLFGTLSHGVVIQLLNFAQAVVLTKRAAEKLFKFIDVYEVVRDVATIDEMFPEVMATQIKTEASMIRSRLGEAMILIFTELENSIKADSGKSQVPGGAVHPLTKYTMNYLEYACEYKNTLEQVFREHQKIERADSHNEPSKQSPFTAQITKVLDLLDSNIEGKAKLYKDPALSSIFMMNNGRYMLKKIKGNELNSLIGDTWYRRKSSDIRQYHKGYQRETWGKLLHCLHPEGLTVNGKVMKPALKERFKSFNAMFDEIHKTQSSWVVGDEQLQSELRVSISNMVIPAYRSFLGRYSQTFTPGRQTEKYVKFQAEDIETYIDELFDGTATPMGRKKQ
ncbi:exocyst complex component exo70b1 [Phtheirospermum japonicum]|uniref:Exocyst subunit Exo70 family protein n=1 Tax=Phtheirospermum japonicum TaxID=374723 RepID=A0A830DHZ0_9LAMI|nr:exocyst complex component exo70b1 [Phtheirospermum japonicum]